MPSTGNKHIVKQPLPRSEEHTSELQSQSNLVCRLLLEKKNHPPYRWTYKPLPGTADANKYNLLSLKIDAKNSIKDATTSYVPFVSVLFASFDFSQLDALGVW